MERNEENALLILDRFRSACKVCLLSSAAFLSLLPAVVFRNTQLSQLPAYLFIESVAAAGPTATKLLQWMGTRGDIFSEKMRKYAVKFQAHAPSDPFPLIWLQVCKAVERQNANTVYIQPIPLGSGSVAQVHRVLLRPNRWWLRGRLKRAVMKVIKPNVHQQIRLDLHILKTVSDCFSTLAGDTSEWFPLRQIVDQFADFLLPQTNMKIEAHNLRVFKSNFAKWRSFALLRMAGGRVILPRVYTELVTENVLTESFEKGVAMDQWLAQTAPAEFERVRHDFANFGCQMFLQMLLLDNFVHCDLHPGNILVRLRRLPRPSVSVPWKPGRSPWGRSACSQHIWRLGRRMFTLRPDYEVVILDGGLVSRLTPADRVNFIHLFKALTFGEGYAAGKLLVERAKKHDCRDLHKFCLQVGGVVEGLIGPPIKMREWILKRGHYLQGGGESRGSVRMTLRDMRIGEAMREIVGLCIAHRVQLEPAFLGVVLAMGIVEGLGVQLDPTMDLIAASRPYLGLIARDAMLKYEQVWWNNSAGHAQRRRARANLLFGPGFLKNWLRRSIEYADSS